MQRIGDVIFIEGHSFSAVLHYRPAMCGDKGYELSLKVFRRDNQWVAPPPGEVFYCSHEYDQAVEQFYAPFFISNTASYFAASTRPDAVVLAAKEVSFHRGFKGDHGGVTQDEVIVPLLMRNASLSSPQTVYENYSVLKFLDAK